MLREVQASHGSLAQQIVGAIMRAVPVGFAHHKEPQRSEVLDAFQKEHAPSLSRSGHQVFYPPELVVEIEEGYRQLATLGSGNHFIELQEDEDGKLGIMLHSGSRNFGLKIATYFNNVAKKLNKQLASGVPAAWDLAYLPADALEGQAYIRWMNLALDFARENRRLMMERTKEIVFDLVERHTGFKGIKVDMEVNAHHNYAALERHGDEDLWVHRKGAIRAREGEIGIIPGAMGSYSYIVSGRGNPESYYSCSHGAGRRMGRKEATRQFSVQEVMDDFKASGVILGKNRKGDVAEEYRKAYKDIDFVIDNERDLVQPVMRLKTVAVVKG
ncbi:MAG: RtcB family protein [Firmicutes bacterium]|nr:RtcB family protein [Bacillota bacterium]